MWVTVGATSREAWLFASCASLSGELVGINTGTTTTGTGTGRLTLKMLARVLTCRWARVPNATHALLPFCRRASASGGRRPPHLQVSRAVNWQYLPADERAAWSVLGWTAEAWDGSKQAPLTILQDWEELTPAQRGAATHGLGYTADLWDAERLASAIVVAPSAEEKAAVAPPGPSSSAGGVVGTLARAAWGVAKTAAPVAGSALARSRHPGAIVAGHMMQAVPSMVDAMASPVAVDGVETVVYLDDSGSMRSGSGASGWLAGSLLDEGKRVLSSMGPLLRGPTRVLKFGHTPTVLAPREPHPPITELVSLGWDGSSGATYMWKMIEDE